MISATGCAWECTCACSIGGGTENIMSDSCDRTVAQNAAIDGCQIASGTPGAVTCILVPDAACANPAP
jgi:hypothetical protein